MQLNLLYGLLSRAYIEERHDGTIHSFHDHKLCIRNIYIYVGSEKKNFQYCIEMYTPPTNWV